MIERRKVQEPFAGPDRRKPGRPPLSDDEKAARPKPRPVRLELDVENAVCTLSTHYGISIHSLLRLAARRLVRDVATQRLILGDFPLDE